MRYSIIITAFNREWCIERCINSAASFLMDGGYDGEIVVVDDGSTDNTVDMINHVFNKLTKNVSFHARLKLIPLHSNQGVCAAKNTGVLSASGEWVIFLDSDDELIPGAFDIVNNVIINNVKQQNTNFPAFFFSTIMAGASFSLTSGFLTYLTLNVLIIEGTNGIDAVPVIRTEIKKIYPFYENIRGYEGLAYLGIANEFGEIPFYKSPIVRVHTSHPGRLSSGSGMSKRWKDVALGHYIVLLKFWDNMSYQARLKMVLRLVKAWILHTRYLISNPGLFFR